MKTWIKDIKSNTCIKCNNKKELQLVCEKLEELNIPLGTGTWNNQASRILTDFKFESPTHISFSKMEHNTNLYVSLGSGMNDRVIEFEELNDFSKEVVETINISPEDTIKILNVLDKIDEGLIMHLGIWYDQETINSLKIDLINKMETKYHKNKDL